MIALDGQSALSPFRLERLNARLEAIHRGTRVQSSWFVYFIDAAVMPEGEQRRRLLEVLEAKDAVPETASLWVVPRLGTISPWSSKATDILRDAGFEVHRVERGTAWQVAGLPAPGSEHYDAVMTVLHDAMTQSVLTSLKDAQGLFLAGQPGPLVHVALGGDARAALAKANAELGLALAEDEIEYLADRYAGQLRALPSQGVQRELDAGWSGAGEEPVRHDQEHPSALAGTYLVRLQGQRGGD
jgi:phosphoribosylformylglycinamidine synthase